MRNRHRRSGAVPPQPLVLHGHTPPPSSSSLVPAAVAPCPLASIQSPLRETQYIHHRHGPLFLARSLARSLPLSLPPDPISLYCSNRMQLSNPLCISRKLPRRYTRTVCLIPRSSSNVSSSSSGETWSSVQVVVLGLGVPPDSHPFKGLKSWAGYFHLLTNAPATSCGLGRLSAGPGQA